jgi:hypothetical protein
MTSNGHKPFRLPERTARLVFEGEYEGAEVVVRLSVPLGLYVNLSALAESSDVGEVANVLENFSRDVLVEWNIEGPDGEPLPADLANIPLDFATLIMQQWTEAAAKSPLALERSA